MERHAHGSERDLVARPSAGAVPSRARRRRRSRSCSPGLRSWRPYHRTRCGRAVARYQADRAGPALRDRAGPECVFGHGLGTRFEKQEQELVGLGGECALPAPRRTSCHLRSRFGRLPRPALRKYLSKASCFAWPARRSRSSRAVSITHLFGFQTVWRAATARQPEQLTTASAISASRGKRRRSRGGRPAAGRG